MTKSPVHGKVAAVTGGGSGIGRALAIELTERGATVSTCDVDEVGLKETAARCGGELQTAVVDVADRSAVRTWAEEVADRSGVVHQVYTTPASPTASRCSTVTGPTTSACWRSTSTASSTAPRRSSRTSWPAVTVTW